MQFELKRPGTWENELIRFCGAFGFEMKSEYVHMCVDLAGFAVGSRDQTPGTRYAMTAGRCCVSYVDKSMTWRSGTTKVQVDVPYDDDLAFGERRDKYFKALFETLSGKELVVRSSGKTRKSEHGFTKVRLERHIVLPEFSSVDELKLKLAAASA